MRERTYWFTDRRPNHGVVWAGRQNKQRYVDKYDIGISFFSDCYKTLDTPTLSNPSSIFIKHPTYKAACDHAGIKPRRIRWGT